jgi:hypothetical protein
MSIMASLEFNGSGAGEIKRHPEVEVLPVARGNRTERMKKVLNRLKEGGGLRPPVHAARHYSNLCRTEIEIALSQ